MIMARNKDWTENESEMSGGGKQPVLWENCERPSESQGN